MQKYCSLFITANDHCIAFSSITGGWLLTELITHQKPHRADTACQTWERYLYVQGCHVEGKLPQGLIYTLAVYFSRYVALVFSCVSSDLILCHCDIGTPKEILKPKNVRKKPQGLWKLIPAILTHLVGVSLLPPEKTP